MSKIPDTLARKLEGREYRGMTMEVRAQDDEEYIVEGYATTFNQPYELWRCRDYIVNEQIDPHAFDECDMSDVIMQHDHSGRVFARTKNNTLDLTVDSTGLKTTGRLGGTELGRQVWEEVKGGYADKMSFGFIVAEDKREETCDRETGVTTVLRTITKIEKLFDVSVVSRPANDATSISARRYADGVIDGIKAERLERAKKKLKLLMTMEEM